MTLPVRLIRKPPKAGPTAIPRKNTLWIYPNEIARRSGVVQSATYAFVAAIVVANEPNNPSRMAPTRKNSSPSMRQYFAIKMTMKSFSNVPQSAIMMTGRRPRRSENAPYLPVVTADINPVHKLTANANRDARACIYCQCDKTRFRQLRVDDNLDSVVLFL